MVDMFQLQRPKKVEKCPPGRKNDVFGALPGGKGGIPKAPVAVGQFPQGAANGGKVWPRTLGSSTQVYLDHPVNSLTIVSSLLGSGS